MSTQVVTPSGWLIGRHPDHGAQPNADTADGHVDAFNHTEKMTPAQVDAVLSAVAPYARRAGFSLVLDAARVTVHLAPASATPSDVETLAGELATILA